MRTADRDKQINIGRVAKTTFSTASIVGVRLATQAMVLVLSARLLGVDGFGLVSAIVAVALVLGPWSGLGYDFIALRSTSSDRAGSNSHLWYGITLVTKTAVPIILAAFVWGLLWSGDKTIAVATVLIFTAELVFFRITELVAKIFQGNERFHEMAFTRLAISVSRLAVLGLVALFSSEVTAVGWGWANLTAALLSLVFSLLFLRARIGIAVPRPGWRPPQLHDGLYFAAGITSVRLSTEFDKSLVLAMAGVSGAGIYAASCRIVSLAVAPVISLVNVVITSLFRLKSRNDRVQLRQRSLVVCAIAVAYGTIIGGLVWLLLPDIAAFALGEEFRALAAGLLPLSVLVIPTSCRLVAEQVVAALSEFRARLVIQWTVAGLSVLMNLIVIPVFGWQGAAWVLVASEVVLASSFLLIIYNSVPGSEEP